MITFDDAFASVYSIGAPILDEEDVPGTVFAPTRYIDSALPLAWPGYFRWLQTQHEPELDPMVWPQLADLSARERVGSRLPYCDPPEPNEPHPGPTESRTCRLKASIEEQLQVPCTSYCAPWGLVDHVVVAAARRIGYRAGCNSKRIQDSPLDPLNYPRVEPKRGESRFYFNLRVSSRFRRLRQSRHWDHIERVRKLS